MFGTNAEKTLEYVDSKKYQTIEQLVDDFLSEEVLKKIL